MFSASNYYEIGSNRGAYIKFGANSDRYFVQFTAAASKTRKLTFKQQVDNVEKSAIRELCEKLREQKVQLAGEFKQRDPQNTGEFKISACQKWIFFSNLITGEIQLPNPILGESQFELHSAGEKKILLRFVLCHTIIRFERCFGAKMKMLTVLGKMEHFIEIID